VTEQTEASGEQETASLATPSDIVTDDKPTAKPVIEPPVFTLLRVEKDGSAVIAGTGPGNTEITLLDGNEELGKTKSGAEGDFAFVLDKPLTAGLHELFLVATPQEGEPVTSLEAGIINVPVSDSDDEVTVLVSATGQPTRILQKAEEEEEVASLQEPSSEAEGSNTAGDSTSSQTPEGNRR